VRTGKCEEFQQFAIVVVVEITHCRAISLAARIILNKGIDNLMSVKKFISAKFLVCGSNN
jgi:hypothetical protein